MLQIVGLVLQQRDALLLHRDLDLIVDASRLDEGRELVGTLQCFGHVLLQRRDR